jgi:hypothetical protein
LPGAKWFGLWRLQTVICAKNFILKGIAVKNFILLGLGAFEVFLMMRRSFAPLEDDNEKQATATAKCHASSFESRVSSCEFFRAKAKGCGWRFAGSQPFLIPI